MYKIILFVRRKIYSYKDFFKAIGDHIRAWITPTITNFPIVNLNDVASTLLFGNDDNTRKESDKKAGPKKRTDPMTVAGRGKLTDCYSRNSRKTGNREIIIFSAA